VCSGRARMHHLLFTMKRSYYRALSKAYPLINDLDLTPARFDLMFVMFTRRIRTGACCVLEDSETQKTIRAALGVSRETVSRMLEGLEQKGFVRRGLVPPFERDGRTKSVELTDVGRAVIRRATKIAYPRGLLADPFVGRTDALQFEFERASSQLEVDQLWCRLRAMSRRLGDFSTLEYPTLDPDD
jgi:DNA-binding MarR family transcriptional regulator